MSNYKIYNGKQKERYLKTIDIRKRSPLYYQRLFDKTAEIETLYNKDCCNFSVNECLELFKFMSIRNLDSLINTKIDLMSYTTWAITETLVDDGINHYDEISIEILTSCVDKNAFDKSILSRDELIQFVSKLQNPREAFVIMCFFEGISGVEYEEIIKLKMSDIKDHICNTCTGRKITVSDDFIKYAKLSNAANEYYLNHGGAECAECLEPSEYIYKNITNRTKNTSITGTYRRMRTTMLRLFKERGYTSVTSNSIINSGAIELVNKLAKQHNISSKDVLYDPELFNIISDKYKISISYRKKWYLAHKDYLEE